MVEGGGEGGLAQKSIFDVFVVNTEITGGMPDSAGGMHVSV